MSVMKKGCLEITQIVASKNQSIFLPQYTEHLMGLLFFRTGSGELTGPSELPLCIEAGSAVVYPLHRPYRLDIWTDASLLLLAFSGSRAEITRAQSVELRQSRPQLDALAGSMEQTRSTIRPAELLAQLAAQLSPEPESIPPYIQAARRVIDECYGEYLTLEELSARVGRSKFHLSRVFRECYHVTPGAYLASVRLAHAAELLTNTNLPVLEVGRRTGFSNSTYFTSLFKKRFGCPPGEYRSLRRNHN